MEKWLHYVWKHRLFDETALLTDAGEAIEIVNVGDPNQHGGPDFFNAKIDAKSTRWAGNVEIHNNSSDWYAHSHHTDPAYDSVILHVVQHIDQKIYNSKGRQIPQITLTTQPGIKEQADRLMQHDSPTPCTDFLFLFDNLHWSNWKSRLLFERVKMKSERITKQLDRTQQDWESVTFRIVARAFGFNTNADFMERLASSIPYNVLLKEKNDPYHTEAIIFGQAGLLVQEHPDPHYNYLRQEYLFLQRKHTLVPLTASEINFGKLHKQNSPYVRLAQFATLIAQRNHLFAQIETNEQIEQLYKLFTITPHKYWDNHYRWGEPSSDKHPKKLSKESIDLILINAVIPLWFALYKTYDVEKYWDQIMELLYILKGENNFITRHWKNQGVEVKNAADSQSLIHLHKEYCTKKRCFNCQIGIKILTKQKKNTSNKK